MKKFLALLFGLGLLVLSGSSSTVLAQATLAPTSMYCLGSCPTEAPTEAVVSPTVAETEEPTITPEETEVEPTEVVPTDVVPTTDPCLEETVSIQSWWGHNHHHRRHRGFFGWFFQWLWELIRQLLEQLGGNGGSLPTPTPTPTPGPTDPCAPTTAPEPTQGEEPTQPVEEPTQGVTPTEAAALTPTTGAITPAPTTAGTLTEVKLMPLGDSITDGNNGTYRTPLWKKMVQTDGDNIDFVGSSTSGGSGEGDQDHEGHSGWTINDIDAQVTEWMNTYQPNIVLLQIGHNDLSQGDSSDTMTAELKQLIAHIFEANPTTYIVLENVIVTTVGDNERWSAYNASMPGIVDEFKAQGKKITLVDMTSSVTLDDLPDGAHPNEEGYRKMTEVLYPVLTSVYKELTGTQ